MFIEASACSLGSRGFSPISNPFALSAGSITHATQASPLKSKDLVLELADGARLLESQCLGGLLQAADHGRGAAEQDLDIGGGLGEPFLQSVSVSRLDFSRRGKLTVIISAVT